MDQERPSSSGSVIIHTDAPRTYIYPPRREVVDTSTFDSRPSSSGTTIIHSDAPRTLIYPPRRPPSEVVDKSVFDSRLPSSGTTIIHYDAPRTLIYPPQQHRYRTGPSSGSNIVTQHAKRKHTETPPPQPSTPKPKTSALVVLLQRHNLAMSTDFAAFHQEFEGQGIVAEYLSLFDLEEIIQKQGDLIYGRDDIAGRTREPVLKSGHDRFYKVVPEPRQLKHMVLKWLRDSVPQSGVGENILLVLLSHGSRNGSVVIGGETKSAKVEYMSCTEVKQAISNLPRLTYFTILNTCCYSGGWTELATTGLGRRFVHAATSKHGKADNFQTLSGKYRGGVFVTALLECLRKNGDGTLSEFVAEIRAEVTSYRHPEDPEKVPPPPQSAVSNTAFWKRKIDAFIPIQRESSLAETASLAMDDIKRFKLAELSSGIRPAKRRDHVPEEIVEEIRDARRLAITRGGSNGEDQIYDACQNLLEGEAEIAVERALLRTFSWRESATLQAERIARHLEEIGIISQEDVSGEIIDEEKLSNQGSLYYNRAFSGSKLIDNTKVPPDGCIGGHWENPLTWLSNLVAAQKKAVSVTRVKNAVEDFLADAVLSKEEAGQLMRRS